MNLRAIGCSFRSAPIELREKLAFEGEKLTESLAEVSRRFGCETAILSTCNRVEFYVANANDGPPPATAIADYLAETRSIPVGELQKHLYDHADADAVLHLFRVTASLDSLVVGEGQIAAQVRKAFETAQSSGTTGIALNLLFPQAIRAAKRARSETGIALGHVSVSSVAVDYVRQVFDHFNDKTILVIGAGKMGQLTLKHLRELKPRQILVTNRSAEKAESVARDCGGKAIPWSQLDDALGQSDIVLSTTGAGEPIMTRARFDAIRAKRRRGTVVILDIAVPRDFEPSIGDANDTFLFNIDDLTRIREQTIVQRQKHIAPAEAIIEQERKKFVDDWTHRRSAPTIRQLTAEFDGKRQAVLDQLLSKLNGKLSEADRKYIEGAFRLFQNQVLFGPINALREASQSGDAASLQQAIKKLFQLGS